MGYRLEAWNRTNTSRRAVFAPPLSAVRHRRAGSAGSETLRVTVPGGDSAISSLTGAAVLRLQREGEVADFTLCRVTSKQRAVGADGAEVWEIAADALWMDLRHGRIYQETADGRRSYAFGLVEFTPARWISEVFIPGYEGASITFAAGVIQAAAPVDLNFDSPTTPLAALRRLEEATGYELQFRYSADGLTCYVDLLTRIGQVSGAVIREGKNVGAIEVLEEEEPAIATRVRARGSGLLTLADATWKVATATGTSSARVLAFSGPHPVIEDGAFVALYWYVPGKGPYLITASSATAGTITVNEAAQPALASGDVGWLATTMAGARLDYLESPSARATYGVKLGEDAVAEDVPDVTNLLQYGSLTGVYVGGLAPGWTAIGAPVTAETTETKYSMVGGQAMRVTAAADGVGVKHATFTVSADTTRPYTGFRVGLTVAAGKVRMELRGPGGVVYPKAKRPATEGLNVTIQVDVGPVDDAPLPPGTYELAVVAHGGAADWYLDFAMVCMQATAEVPAYVSGQGAQLLWSRAAAALAAQAEPRLEVRVDVPNLYEFDRTRFAHDRIDMGDTLKIWHRLGRYDLRVLELEEDLVDNAPLRLALARTAARRVDRGAELFLPAGGQSRPPALAPPPVATRAAIIWTKGEVDAGSAYVSALGNEATATLRLYTKTTRAAAFPSVPTATLAARQGTFPAVALATSGALFYRVEAVDGSGVPGDVEEGAAARTDGAPPVPRARRELSADRTTADVHVHAESKTGERSLLRLRDSDASGATTWLAVASDGAGNPTFTPAELVSGTETAATQWFRDGDGAGSNTARKLQAIPLLRDQVTKVWVQLEGFDSALRSAWIPVPLEVREQPWLESVDLVFDEGTDKLFATAAGGAFCAAARFELDSDPAFPAPKAIIEGSGQTLADGGRVTVSASVLTADRAKTWYLRVTPYNGALVGGNPTGYAGKPQFDTVAVPASEGGAGIQPPTATITPPTGHVASRASVTLQYAGARGAGGTGNLEYRVRKVVGGADVAWGAWTATGATSFTTTEVINKDAIYETRVQLEVRDGAGRTGAAECPVGPKNVPDSGYVDTSGRVIALRDTVASVDVSGADARIGKRGFDSADSGVRLPPSKMGNGTIPAGVNVPNTMSVLVGGVALPLTYGLWPGSAADGESVSWPAGTFPGAPEVHFLGGGYTFSSGLGTKYGPVDAALNVTALGFTMRARLQEAAAGTTARSASFVGSLANKGFAPEAVGNLYKVNASVTVNGGVVVGLGEYDPSNVTVAYRTNDGLGWVTRLERTFPGNPSASSRTYTGAAAEQLLTVAGMGLDDDFECVEVDEYGNGGSVTPSTVTWDEGTEPAYVARADSSRKVTYLAIYRA